MTNSKSLSTPTTPLRMPSAGPTPLASFWRHDVVAYTIPGFCHTFAVGRTRTYRLIDEKAIEVRKVGRRTLIDAESAARWYASLPGGTA